MRGFTYFLSIILFSSLLIQSCQDDSSTSPADDTIPTNGLMAFYPLDGNAGDSSGNGHHGTLTSTVPTQNRFGVMGNAVYFIGYQSYAELGTWFNYPYFTLSLWVKPESLQVQWADIIENNHTNDRAWNVQQAYGYPNEMAFGVCIEPRPTDSPMDTLQPSVWQNLVCVKDSNATRMYINGALVDSAVNLGPTIYDGTEQLGLAHWYNEGFRTRFWRGAMDNVRLYNRPLRPNEVNALYRDPT